MKAELLPITIWLLLPRRLWEKFSPWRKNKFCFMFIFSPKVSTCLNWYIAFALDCKSQNNAVKPTQGRLGYSICGCDHSTSRYSADLLLVTSDLLSHLSVFHWGKMHFSIPETEVLSCENGSTYVVSALGANLFGSVLIIIIIIIKLIIQDIFSIM